jgi:hypothetical protein
MASARLITVFDFSLYWCGLIAVRCRCGHTRHLPPAVLANCFSWSTTFREAERRLRCVECGAKKARLVPIPAS